MSEDSIGNWTMIEKRIFKLCFGNKVLCQNS